MNYPPAIGSWVSFDADPASVELCVPSPRTKRFCGKVVAIGELPNLQPGNVPTCCVKLRGRTGKQVSICFSSHHAKVHESQEAAVADTLHPTIYHDISVSTPDRTRPTPANRQSASGTRRPSPAR